MYVFRMFFHVFMRVVEFCVCFTSESIRILKRKFNFYIEIVVFIGFNNSMSIEPGWETRGADVVEI